MENEISDTPTEINTDADVTVYDDIDAPINDEEDTKPVHNEEEKEDEPKSSENSSSSPLQDLIRAGLSEREAMLVLSDREQMRAGYSKTDSLPRMAHSPRLNISYGDLMEMKEIFSDLSDTEINRLYNKVTK